MTCSSGTIFLSTPSARRATGLTGAPSNAEQFLSTPSARRATKLPPRKRSNQKNFYPRPPRGGRRSPILGIQYSHANFYPRPPRGGRLRVLQAQNQTERISIHALREEGDRWPRLPTTASGYFYPRPPRGGRPSAAATVSITMPFLSTPSARRATPDPAGAVVSDQFLSTPSARRATSRSSFRSRPAAYFYPRPPRGGRRSRPTHG